MLCSVQSLPMGEFGQAIFDAIMPLHACRNRHANIIPCESHTHTHTHMHSVFSVVYEV